MYGCVVMATMRAGETLRLKQANNWPPARRTLARWVIPDENGRMPRPIGEETMLGNFHDVCKGLHFMHTMSPPVTHFDLKLENVLEFDNPANGTSVCKICDFGSASTRTFDPNTADRRAKLYEEDLLARYSTAMNRSPEMLDLHRGQAR